MIKLAKFCISSPCIISFSLILCLSYIIPSSQLYERHEPNLEPEETHVFSLDTGTTIHEVDDRFLSYSLDSFMVQKPVAMELLLTNRVFRRIVKNLGPSYLRIGGTASDYLVFDCPHGPPARYESSRRSYYEELVSYHSDRDCYSRLKASSLQRTEDLVNLTPRLWETILHFAHLLDWKVIFGLNVLLRNFSIDHHVGHWDPTNAISIMDYTERRLPKVDVVWELGNEPNIFPTKYNLTLSPEILAQDFDILSRLIKERSLGAQTTASAIAGPDVTRMKPPLVIYLRSFLHKMHKLGSLGNLDHLTWHHYYKSGKVSNLNDFIDPYLLDEFAFEIYQLKSQVLDGLAEKKDIWLGETSSTWGGGTYDYSDRYVAGFMFLDKIGLCAKNGMTVLVRQTLYSGHYALIDNFGNPNPDYWIAVLYKLLVGKKVLKIKFVTKECVSGCSPKGKVAKSHAYKFYEEWLQPNPKSGPFHHRPLPNSIKSPKGRLRRDKRGSEDHKYTLEYYSRQFTGQTVRAYAHCASPDSPYYRPGDVMIYAMNLNRYPIKLKVDGLPIDTQYLYAYYLSPEPGLGLTTKTVRLNYRQRLKLTSGYLPHLEPKLTPITNGHISMLPLTYAFFHVPNANAKACL